MIEARRLCRSFGTIEAIRDVTLTVKSGEIAGVLGPNGAGKTTLLRLLTGILRPDSGSIEIGGVELADNPAVVKQRIGYLPESAPVYGELNTAEYLEFLAGGHGLSGTDKRLAIERVSEECGLTDALYRPLGLLSKGYRQRAALAGALVHAPDFLILDEPTTGLDPLQIGDIRELIQELGEKRTVLLSTHILQEAEALCSRVTILSRGRIAAEGSPAEISSLKSGERRYRVRGKGIAPEELRSRAVQISGFVRCDALRECEGGSEIELAVHNSASDGSEIFEWAVDEGLQLLAFHPLQASLEEVFMDALSEKEET